MMLLGLVVHSAITYGIYEDLGSWPIRDSITHLSNDFIVNLIHSFRMQIFFLVSGFFGSMLFYDRNPFIMIKNKINRIIFFTFIPLFYINIRNFILKKERWPSGRRRTLGKRVCE